MIRCSFPFCTTSYTQRYVCSQLHISETQTYSFRNHGKQYLLKMIHLCLPDCRWLVVLQACLLDTQYESEDVAMTH